MVKPYSDGCLIPKHPCAHLILAGEVDMVRPEFDLPIQRLYGSNDLNILPVLHLSHLALLLRFPLQAKHLRMGCCALGCHGWRSSQQRVSFHIIRCLLELVKRRELLGGDVPATLPGSHHRGALGVP